MGRGMLRLADVVEVPRYKFGPATRDLQQKAINQFKLKLTFLTLSSQTRRLQKIYLLEYELFSPSIPST
jgi:hypothetical protein